MENKYMLKPVLKTIKQSFYLEDENGNKVYEGNMLKFSLFGAAPHEFVNRVSGKTEQHKVGKTITAEEGDGGLISMLSKKSYFKFDGKNIWDHLHDLGIRIESGIAGNKLGMRYDVTLRGEHIATIANSSPKGKSILTTDMYYDVFCEEKDLDIVFLVAFSIAKTEQTFYN
ncbi:MAG: hypothetical protein IKO45_01375 [Clostridia bacterium]|nr:hypothetical protein [Clostridia bacterium]